jgi:Na+-transporting methylmalonyl-CoA/oxaloacetate decarboxylase gamma subunit
MAVTILDNWYTRITKWYLSRPWYMRLLCIGLVIVIIILFLLRFVFRGIPKEYSQTADIAPPLPDPTGANDVEEVTNAENTLAIKNQMIGQLKEREKSETVFSQQAAEIINASNMGDLHDLRKKFNL